MKLERDFYLRDDVQAIARELLGKVLISRQKNAVCAGMITETEAYAGITDKASHAYNNRRTMRTEIMFGPGGFAYIYLCYGVHSLLNVVTNVAGIPHAVLLRGILPLEGLETIYARLRKNQLKNEIINGPGKLTKALSIHYTQSGLDLTGNDLYIEDRAIDHEGFTIKTTPRIGIDYAGEDAFLPYRFVMEKK